MAEQKRLGETHEITWGDLIEASNARHGATTPRKVQKVRQEASGREGPVNRSDLTGAFAIEAYDQVAQGNLLKRNLQSELNSSDN